MKPHHPAHPRPGQPDRLASSGAPWPAMTTAEVFVVALWAGAVFGTLEGLVLGIMRAYPAVLAPFKVSWDVLWLAPLLDIALFGLGAVIWAAGVRGAARRRDLDTRRATVAAFSFAGVVAVVTAPAVLHPASALLLALGLTAVAVRRLRGSEPRVVAALKRRWGVVPAGILGVSLLMTAGSAAGERWQASRLPPPPSRAPNVLILVLDTVRALPWPGEAGESLTPAIDRLARTGLTFSNAWAPASWSLPSQASILTGLDPIAHGADWPRLELSAGVPTLAEYFAGRGYATGAFSSNAAWATPEYLGRGFLTFDPYRTEDLLRRTSFGRVAGRLLWHVGFHYAGRGAPAAVLNDQLIAFLDDHRGRPVFAYVCFMDVNRAFHAAKLNRFFWEPEPPAAAVVDAYRRGLRALDAEVGRLVDRLRDRGDLDDTILVVTSDHGESFGSEAPGDHDPAGHGTSLYPEQLRVPLVVSAPGRVPPGASDRLVSLRAVAPTLASLAGLGGSPFGGESLLDVLSDSQWSSREVLATLHYDRYDAESIIAVAPSGDGGDDGRGAIDAGRPPAGAEGTWQFIVTRSPDAAEELYHLARDPYATRDLSERRDIRLALAERLRRLLRESDRRRGDLGASDRPGR